MDPIATIATPQELVLWSRLGPYDRAELDRLLWKEKKLFEWQAFIYPIEDLPLLRARCASRGGRTSGSNGRSSSCRSSRRLRNYVLRELERAGRLPSRELEHDADAHRRAHHLVGDARPADVDAGAAGNAREGSRSRGADRGQRLWDLAERVWPGDGDRPAARGAERLLEEKRRRALGVWLERGRLARSPRRERRARSEADDAPLSVRPAHPRPRPRRGALGVLLPPGDVRAEGQAPVRLLRPARAARRPHRRTDRPGLRPQVARA